MSDDPSSGICISDGGLMNSKIRGNRMFQEMGWVGLGAVALLLLSAGLEFFAQHANTGTSLAGVLLALFLAFWSYVLGLVGLFFLSMRWLAGWRGGQVTRVALSQNSSAERRSRSPETPEQEGLQFLQQDVDPVDPSRSSGESGDRNKTTSPSRAA